MVAQRQETNIVSTNNDPSAEVGKNSQPHWRHRRPRPRKDIELKNKSSDIPILTPNTAIDPETKDVEQCFICTEPISCYAVGVCNHRTCHLCSLRLRALYKNPACGYCKTELTSVVFTKDPNRTFESFNLRELPAGDEKTSVYFESQELCDETIIILRFNCPDSNCDFHADSGWKELKEHVKTMHQRSLCDICIKHKKIFSHEHTQFTRAQLQRHLTVGDSRDPNNTTGFKGHPECHFCRISFYDGDQLFEHCRDKHEQCHICIRDGSGRNDYYTNYDTLEQHFLKDHFLCSDQECLNKKFVVFKSDIDLKAHVIQEHRGVANQRAQIRQTRQIEVNFTYSDNNRHRGRDRGQESSRRKEEQHARKEADSDPKESGSKQHEPSAETSKSKQKGRINPPPEFGSTLTNSVPSSSNGTAKTTKERTSVRDKAPAGFGQLTKGKAVSVKAPAVVDSETLSNHSSFMERLAGYLGKNKEQIAKFKQLTSSYRGNLLSVSQYLDSIRLLVPTSKDQHSIVGKIVNGVVDLLDIDEKKQELLTTWRDQKIQKTQDFPKLGSNGGSGDLSTDSATRRVLVIKSKSSKANQFGGHKTQIWDRVAAAAKKPSSRSNSPTLFPSLPSAPKASASSTSSTAWSGRRPAPHFVSPAAPIKKAPAEHFPSLPKVPKQPKIPGLSNRGQKTESAWGKQKEAPSAEMEDLELSNGKKKKGKQVLLYYG